MIVPLFVGRAKSIAALEEVMNSDRQVLLFTQRNAADDDPTPEALYDVGTVASVLQLLKLPDGTVKVLVEGVARARVRKFTDRGGSILRQLLKLLTTKTMIQSSWKRLRGPSLVILKIT